MTNKEAFNVLVSAAQEFRGTAKDHALIVEAAKVIQAVLEPVPQAENVVEFPKEVV